MKDFLVYEHISGIPEHMDTINEEIIECIQNNCRTERQAERYIEEINNNSPVDKHGRKRNLYIFWIDKK